MITPGVLIMGLLAMVSFTVLLAYVVIRSRHLDRWLNSFIRNSGARRAERRAQRSGRSVTDVLVCVADHYEPCWEPIFPSQPRERVERWRDELPQTLAGRFDSDGRKPQHSFFYPYEEYRPELFAPLLELCQAGYGEIEVHLHHGYDTEQSLANQLSDFVKLLHWRYGALGTHRATGDPGYVFIHGNWALNNSTNDPADCGVNDEIKVLLNTGCYADMTLPSAPSPAQVDMVNCIYYATSNPEQATGHAHGPLVRRHGAAPDGHLMLITGPLGFNWRSRKLGVLPRIENGELAGNVPWSEDRVDRWLNLSSCVAGVPEWRFIKLHCHGVQEKDHSIMLGSDCRAMYEALERRCRDTPGYRLHYVTAREMVNIAMAAEAGETGNPNDYRDYRVLPPTWRPAQAGIAAG